MFQSDVFSCIAIDEKGVIQLFNVGAERMLKYAASDVINKLTYEAISDTQELLDQAAALSLEFDTPIAPGFDALVYKAARGIADSYEMTKLRKDGSRFPAMVSVTAPLDVQKRIIGYLLIGTDNTSRKQNKATEALRKSEQRAQHILDTARDAFVTMDSAGKITDWNARAEGLLGWSRREALGRILAETIIPLRYREAHTRGMQHFFTTGESSVLNQTVDIFAQHRDGREIPVRLNIWADTSSPVYTFNAFIHDASEQKKLSLYTRSLMEASLDPLFIVGVDGKITDVNEAAIAVTGASREELIGSDYSTYATEPEKARAAYEQVHLHGFITDFSLTLRHRNGRLTDVLFNASLYKDAHGKVLGLSAAARDVTERNKAQAKLLESEARTRAILAAAVDAIIIIDASGIIESLNKAAEILFGYPEQEMLGQNVKMLMPAPYKAEHDNYLRNYTSTGAKKIMGIGREVVGLRKNGDTFPMDLAVSEVQTGGRRLFTGIVRDTSERKRIEQTLQEKNVELEHASRMKSEFLATMSHELRTPLNAIIGFSEALRDGLMGPTSDTQQEYIGDIFNSGQHLLALINDILDLSKVEAGMMALELEPVDLQTLLSNSLAIVRERALSQRIRLETDIDANLGQPMLDMRKTKQIIYNLLANAVKFSAAGGTVQLRALSVPRSAVGTLPGPWPVRGFALAESPYQEFLQIEVCDSGIGIAPKDLSKLFLAFSQIDSSLSRKFEGTGLGLAMVKQLAELHGGSVAVAGAEGAGARFAVWLPMRAQEPDAFTASHAAAITRIDADPVERFALVVEDDDQSAKLLRLLLEAEGFSVLHAASAEAALLLATRQSLSLIALDIELPGMDGWAFLQRLRESGKLSQVPVLIVAGVVDDHLALSRGASAILEKPICRVKLTNALVDLALHPVPEKTYTLLLVDDDPQAVELMATYFPSPAYAVVRAYGGGEAILLAQRLIPDLILLDLLMPDVTGFEVVEALASDPATAAIPILVLSAKAITAEDRTALNGRSGKVVRVIEKGAFNQSHFIADVRRLLPSA